MSERSATTIDAPIAAQRGDKHLWGIYIALCLVSIVELYSASSREVSMSTSMGVLGPVVRHVGILGVGFVVLWVIQSFHYKWTLAVSWPFIFISVVLMGYVLVFGDIINGARRSFQLAGFQVAPSEFIKLSAVLGLSLIMARSQLKNAVGVSKRGIIIAAIFTGFLGALLIKNGATNTILLMAIALSMMLIGGASLGKQLAPILGIFAVLVVLFIGVMLLIPSGDKKVVEEYIVSPDYEVTVVRHEQEQAPGGRLETWLARMTAYITGDSIPKYEQKLTAANRQEMYSYMAQANGGLHGVFPGNSRETARLPLAFSDFIFSIIVEDLGFFGGLAILILYLWLLGRAAAIASRCSRAYPALLVIGMAVMVVYQALIHMAIVTGVSPVSGQPLPLISKGGSSILATSIAFGVMLSVSKYAATNRDKRIAVKNEIDTLPEEMRAENPTQL